MTRHSFAAQTTIEEPERRVVANDRSEAYALAGKGLAWEARMRGRLFGSMRVVEVGALLLLLALSGIAQAKTCSDRLQVCNGYCVKSMGDNPRCHAKCRQLDQECMSSGCWESKIVAKQ
jgi:hypothetical protein